MKKKEVHSFRELFQYIVQQLPFRRFFPRMKLSTVLSWTLYDFANSSYSLLIISFAFPIYFKEVIAGLNGDFWWGLVISISILLGGISAPFIGALADYDQRKKRKFILFALVAMLGTASLYFTGSGMLLSAALLFIATNLCFEVAIVFYDSFLNRVSTAKTVGRVSGLGWGLGYLGGVVAMLLLKPWYGAGYAGALESTYKLTFPLTALFFFLFSLPLFFLLSEKPVAETSSRTGPAPTELVGSEKFRESFRRVLSTLKEIKKHKTIAWFILGFYFLNDALVTLFSFISLYAHTTLLMELSEIAVILLLIQLVGFPSAIGFGWLSDRYGAKRILLSTLLVWCLIIVLLVIATAPWMLYGIAVLAGVVVGSSQAVARSWLSRLVPVEKRTEFFGFNGFASKIAATTGPVVFGSISVLTGSQRLALLALLPFFIISLLIFWKKVA